MSANAPTPNLAQVLRQRANAPRFSVSMKVPLGATPYDDEPSVNLAKTARIVDPAAATMGPDAELVEAADRITALEEIIADLRRSLKLPRVEVSAMEIGAIRRDVTVILDALDRWDAVRSRVTANAIGRADTVIFQFPAIGGTREILRGSVAQHLDAAIDKQYLSK